MTNYGCKDYWNKRYTESGDDASFEWLESYQTLQDILAQFFTHKDIKILMLGSGNADFSADIYDEGYHNITNVDFSEVVIEQMIQKNAELRPKMVWLMLDVTEMSRFVVDTFDLVIDKSTIDCLFCREDHVVKVAKMMMDIQRILKPGGTYFLISTGQPKNRASHFVRKFLSWDRKEYVLHD